MKEVKKNNMESVSTNKVSGKEQSYNSVKTEDVMGRSTDWIINLLKLPLCFPSLHVSLICGKRKKQKRKT